MPDITQHAPKVSTRSVDPYARESSREKRQRDRHTDGLSKTTFLDTFQIRSYLEIDFLRDAYTSMGHGSNDQNTYYFLIFQDRTMLKHVIQKASA